MNANPIRAFILTSFLAIIPACCLTLIGFYDPALFWEGDGGVFLTLASPCVLIGMIGLVFRRCWALWLHIALWTACLSFRFYGWLICPCRRDLLSPVLVVVQTAVFLLFGKYLGLLLWIMAMRSVEASGLIPLSK